MAQTVDFPRTAAHPTVDPVREYTTVAKWFHWITVVLIAIALPLGFLIKYIEAPKLGFYAIHESAGLTLLFVAIARLAWRFANPPPPLPPQVPRAMRGASHAVHALLYTAIIVQPMLGFFSSQAYDFPMRGPTAYLRLIDMPVLIGKDLALGGVLSTAHSVVGISIAVLLVLHIGGAVVHQAIRRDNVLLRMV